MPRPPSPLRRAGVASVALATAAGALLLVSSAPASAAPWAGQWTTGTSYSTSGGGCAVTDPGTTVGPLPMAANAATPLNQAGSSVANGGVGDSTALSSSVAGSGSVSESGGSLTGFNLSLAAKASVVPALGAGSACTSNAQAQGGFQGTFSLATAGVLDLDLKMSGPGMGVYQLQLVRIPGATTGSIYITVGEAGRVERTVKVPAGDYQIQLVGAAQATNATTPGASSSTDVRLNVNGAYRPLGAADGAAKGTGLKYLKFSDSQNCATHSVTADFTKKAGKKAKKGKKPVLSKATFFVDGTKVKSVRKPHKRTLVTLTNLPSDDVVEVEAVIKVRGKGKVTVRRSYLPC